MTTRDGSRYDSGVTWPLWDLREPATDADLRGKLWSADEFEDVRELVELLAEK
ncbi:MAG: hypothetical protein ETSY2_14055 [Candidatus Entotheonella gemina]|uniref:Uncharacterized protein n=1 Tax=Candidatus Entotheonella gemina TaxID=1429439 RepID=W4MAL8_9BACT|nr:MAG: hypothetical protein ETSY2_14055 [Candidatus Entotheonella gemina]